MKVKQSVILLTAAVFLLLAVCTTKQQEQEQPITQPPAVEEPEELAPPVVVETSPPPVEEIDKDDIGCLEGLEVYCEQHDGMYHLWVEIDKESMKSLTKQQYKNYTFGTGARGGNYEVCEADGEEQTVYWTTFVFPDGTGICRHAGNWRWGSYGVLDESLRIPQPTYHVGSDEDIDDELTVTLLESINTD